MRYGTREESILMNCWRLHLWFAAYHNHIAVKHQVLGDAGWAGMTEISAPWYDPIADIRLARRDLELLSRQGDDQWFKGRPSQNFKGAINKNLLKPIKIWAIWREYFT